MSQGTDQLGTELAAIGAELANLRGRVTALETAEPPVEPPPVEPPEPPVAAGRIFAADWSWAIGVSNQAVLDGGKFNQRGGNGGSVVPVGATGIQWPTGLANALRVTSGAGEGWTFARKTGMPTPAVGESRFYRVLFSLHMPASNDNQSHPIQDGNAGSDMNWELAIRHDSADRPDYRLQFQFHTNNPWPTYIIELRERLQERVVYQIEWAVHRVEDAAVPQFTFEPKISDLVGNQLYSAADFAFDGNRAGYSAAHRFNFNNVANMSGLNTGCNQSGWTAEGTFYGYQSGVMIRSDRWPGVYRAGEAA